MRHDRPSATGSTMPRLVVPPSRPVTPEEIARRRALFAKVMRLREEIGPIGVPVDELVRQGRDESDAAE